MWMSKLQIAIAFDQLCNALAGGYADETLSARAWRKGQNGGRWGMTRALIDAIFFWQENHCQTAYQSEIARFHLPAEYREGTTE